MDTMVYQTLVTEWGLGRVRAQEGETLDNAEDPGPPDAAPIFVAYSHLSCGLVTMAHYSWIFSVYQKHVQRSFKGSKVLCPSGRRSDIWQVEQTGGWIDWNAIFLC